MRMVMMACDHRQICHIVGCLLAVPHQHDASEVSEVFACGYRNIAARCVPVIERPADPPKECD